MVTKGRPLYENVSMAKHWCYFWWGFGAGGSFAVMLTAWLLLGH